MDISFVFAFCRRLSFVIGPSKGYKQSKTYARAGNVAKSMGWAGHDFCVIKKHAYDEQNALPRRAMIRPGVVNFGFCCSF
jgi:hypothetical protein